MTQEEKELILKDICGRLPYGVMCEESRHGSSRIREIDTVEETVYCDDFDEYVVIENIKPYLRPVSSMTEEECDMVEEIIGDKCIFDFMSNGDIVLKQGQFSQNKLAKLYDYYNSIHVDYRGLIEQGLANEAPEGMYKN